MSGSFKVQDIKNAFLKIRAYFKTKKGGFERNTKNYQEATKVGVLFSSESEEDFQSLEKFVKQLYNDIKQVDVLVFQSELVVEEEEEEKKTTKQYQFFSYRDISLVGDIKKEEVTTFLSVPYDYICCVSTVPQPILEHILKTANGSCRIGNYSSSSDVFELTIESQDSNNLSEAFNDILRYWKNISKN